MSDLLDILYDGDTEQAATLKESLRTEYTAVRNAIIELASGERVVSLTISGKTTQYGQADLPQLRILKKEYESEIRGLLSTSQSRVFRVQTSKGL